MFIIILDGFSSIVLYTAVTVLIIWRAKLLKYDWLMRRAFFLNSGQKLFDPFWLRRFILSIRTKYQSIHNKDFFINKVLHIKYMSSDKIYVIY